MSSTTSELAPRLPRRAKLASSTGSASVTTASSSRNVLPGSHCGGLRLFRHDDPSYQVSNNPRRNSAQNRDHSPQQPHERHIHVDIIRQTRTHPSNLSIRPRTLQLSARNRCHPNPPPAVSAKISVIRNRLPAIIAVHIKPPAQDTSPPGEQFPTTTPMLPPALPRSLRATIARMRTPAIIEFSTRR